MPRFGLLHISLLSMLSFSSVFGSDFLSQAFTNCSQAFYDCGMGGNVTQACTSLFGDCLDDNVFVNNPIYPEACDLSAAATENFWWVTGISIGVMAVAVVAPICLKVCAWGINKCARSDPAIHPIRNRIGRALVIATDPRANEVIEANGDGNANEEPEPKVTATDLINPQVAVAVICTSLPVTFGITASKQAALCASAKAALQANYPQYYAKLGTFLRTSAFSTCASTFYSCGWWQNITDTCISAFGTCLDDNVFVAEPAYPEACFLRDAMAKNVGWVVGVSAGAVASVLVIPVILKVCAYGINKCARANPETHPWMKKFGDALVIMFDTNQDGIVTASELINPQLIIGIFSLVLPITVGTDYNTQDAYCTSALRALRATFPQ